MAHTSLQAFLGAFPVEAELPKQIEQILEGAVRAPSTHNSQPWRFRIQGNTLDVYRDERVQLPNSDKDTQYAHISIGFLLHHIWALGSYMQMEPSIVVTGETKPLARVTFSPASVSHDDSFLSVVEALFARRNRRGVFADAKIPEALLRSLADPIHLPKGLTFSPPAIVTDSHKAGEIGKYTLETMERVYERPAFRKEMSQWVVPTGSTRKDGIPGYSLNQPLVLSWILPSLIRLFNIGKVPGKASAAALSSAPAIFAFGANENPAEWLAIGFEASWITLRLVSEGFSASVFVATAELPDIREKVTAMCGLKKPLRFLFAAGKLEGAVDWVTPRKPLTDKLLP